MVSVAARMRKLQAAITAIRLGPGAAKLPQDVRKIELRFAYKMNGGHMGARKFWREELPRLKYHNPAVAMTVHRTELAEDPSIMSIHYGPPSIAENATTSPSPSSLSSPVPDNSQATEERIEQLDMKNYTNSEILDALLKLTKAQPVEQTPDDIELLARLKREAERSAEDAKLSLEVRTREKRDRELLEQARGDL